jgi:hypothetical protein
MPYDVDKPADLKAMREKLQTTYKGVTDEAVRQAIHVFNSVFPQGEGKAWASVYSKMNERGLSKKASASRVAARYLAAARIPDEIEEDIYGSVPRSSASRYIEFDIRPEGRGILVLFDATRLQEDWMAEAGGRRDWQRNVRQQVPREVDKMGRAMEKELRRKGYDAAYDDGSIFIENVL